MFTRTERTEKIESLQKEFSEAKGLYLTDFTNINVDKINEFRTDLRNTNSKYIVVRNTLACIAMEKAGLDDLIPFFKGPIGIAISNDDPISPARIIKNFKNKKENKGLLKLKVAYVDGNILLPEEVTKLANLPSREVLLAQLLSVFSAPISNFVGSLNGVLTKFVGTLEAVKNKKEKDQ